MTAPALRWAFGLAISLAAHGAAGFGFYWALRPDPVTDQPVPATRMEMQTYRIDRAQARETEPDAEATPARDAQGAQVSQGAITRSRAWETAPPAMKAAISRPAGQAVAASPATGTGLSETAATSEAVPVGQPAGDAIAAVQAPVTSATAQQITGRAAAEAAPRPEVVTPSEHESPQVAAVEGTETRIAAEAAPRDSLPPRQAKGAALPSAGVPSDSVGTIAAEAANLAETAPRADSAKAVLDDGRKIATVEVDNTPISPGPARAENLPEAVPDVDRTTATLAYSGSEELNDPVSLAAVQSFMAPETIDTEHATRDDLADVLAAVPCARLRAQYRPEDNTLELAGHVPEDDLRGTVLAALREQVGRDIPVTGNLHVLPRPQCGALAGIASVGLPQSTDQFTNARIVGEDTHAREFDYRDGEPLILDLEAPDYDAYLYVDYFDADGQVIHLSPNESVHLKRHPAGAELQVGARESGGDGLHITIGPPFGQEIAVAFAASAPLYEGTRPLVEPAAPYLEFLAERVAETKARTPDFKGEWVYFFVSTRQR